MPRRHARPAQKKALRKLREKVRKLKMGEKSGKQRVMAIAAPRRGLAMAVASAAIGLMRK